MSKQVKEYLEKIKFDYPLIIVNYKQGHQIQSEDLMSLLEAYHKEQLKALTVTEGEMMVKRHSEFKKAKANLSDLGEVHSGSFYAGFRRCFNWLKNIE